MTCFTLPLLPTEHASSRAIRYILIRLSKTQSGVVREQCYIVFLFYTCVRYRACFPSLASTINTVGNCGW